MMSDGQTPEEMLAGALGGRTTHIGAVTPLAFRCRCSRERVEGVLSMLGADELETLLAQEGRAEVTCRFCGDRYVLERGEVEALDRRARGTAEPVM